MSKENSKNLVVVESPAKARTVGRYLGDKYTLKATVGHVRDLPEKELGVDPERGFEPVYVTLPGKTKVLNDLRKAARKAADVYLATDPDREGEAIAWHVTTQLNVPEDRVHRIRFHEVTREAILRALEQVNGIDLNLVNSQQARRILDRLVGYQVSPILWDAIKPGLSAGRVQTVALRLVCEREAEREAFEAEEYWTIEALLRADGREFTATLVKVDGEKAEIRSEEEAQAILEELDGRPFVVGSVERKERTKRPAPPFITSTLQQAATRRLRFSTKRTMRIAQQLYEGLEVDDEGPVGLITYMRTDSSRVSETAIQSVRAYIEREFGSDYLPDQPVRYRARKGAQEAHEAIRPTSMGRGPEQLKGDLDEAQWRLYGLIWQRFLASQMRPARYDVTTVEFPIGQCVFRATGSILTFEGFLKVYGRTADEQGEEDETDRLLPDLAEGMEVGWAGFRPEQHFTQPPARFNEGTLVKELEARGIGRPSTYAAIISTLLDRKYVRQEERQLAPTELGRMVNDLLIRTFPDIFDVDFTRRMEEQLDRIEEGEVDWRVVLEDFYGPFKEAVREGAQRSQELLKEAVQVPQEEAICPNCGRTMIVKWSKTGRFLACPAYPECKTTKPLDGGPEPLDEACPECGEGQLQVKRGRYGPFVACSRYPDCRYTRRLKEKASVQETDEVCPECASPMVIREGRYGKFYACSAYPKCKKTKPFITGFPCPREGCDGELALRRSRRGKYFFGCTKYPECRFTTWRKPVEATCPSCEFTVAAEKARRGEATTVTCLRCEEEFEATPEEVSEGA